MKLNVLKITKIVIDVMFYGGIIVTILLPLLLKLNWGYLGYNLSGYVWKLTIVYGICGILSLLIVWELRKIFKTVLKEDCFIRDNVTCLKKMGNFSFAISVVLTLKSIVLYFTFAAIAMAIVFVVAGLFSKVLAQVFDTAVTYKLENDFTI